MDGKMTDIIIPTYNNANLTADCFRSIKKHTKKGTYRIIWVDNGSRDMLEAVHEIQGVNRICVHLTQNKGFVGAVNEGMRISDADTVCMLNNDTVVTANWLEKLNKALYSTDRMGIVGAMTGYHKNGMDSHHSLSLHDTLLPFEAKDWPIDKINSELELAYSGQIYNKNLEFVAFLCAAIKREVVDKIGPLDPNYAMGMWDDLDYNRSVKEAGYTIALALDTCIYHRGRSTFNIVEQEEGLDVTHLIEVNRDYLDRKWAGKGYR